MSAALGRIAAVRKKPRVNGKQMRLWWLNPQMAAAPERVWAERNAKQVGLVLAKESQAENAPTGVLGTAEVRKSDFHIRVEGGEKGFSYGSKSHFSVPSVSQHAERGASKPQFIHCDKCGGFADYPGAPCVTCGMVVQ